MSPTGRWSAAIRNGRARLRLAVSAGDVVEAQPAMAARRDDALDRAGAEARNAQQHLALGAC